MSGPTLIARFVDGEVTRMSVYTSLARLDVARGVRLARHAYRQRTGNEPPAIVAAEFVQNGETLRQYSADELAEVAP
jgi:hypothetical protein